MECLEAELATKDKRIDALEAELKEKDKRINTLENQVESLSLADLDNVEIRDEGSEDEGPFLDALWMLEKPLGTLVDQNHQRAKDALKASEELDGPDPEDIAQNEEAARQIAQTPGERLTMMPEDVCENVNQKRTRFLLTDLKRYAQKAKDGWVLDPSTIRSVLYAREQTAASEHDQTVARVRDCLDPFCDDEVAIVRSGQKKLLHFTEDIVKRCANLKKIHDRCPSLVCESQTPVSG